MIGYRNNENPFEFKVGEALAGVRFDRIEITREDLSRIYEIAKSKTLTKRFIDWLQDLPCWLSADATEMRGGGVGMFWENKRVRELEYDISKLKEQIRILSKEVKSIQTAKYISTATGGQKFDGMFCCPEVIKTPVNKAVMMIMCHLGLEFKYKEQVNNGVFIADANMRRGEKSNGNNS